MQTCIYFALNKHLKNNVGGKTISCDIGIDDGMKEYCCTIFVKEVLKVHCHPKSTTSSYLSRLAPPPNVRSL